MIAVLKLCYRLYEKNQLHKLPEKDYAEIKYETLDKNPKDVIKALYQKLNIEYTETFDKKIDEFLKSLQDFKKNIHVLSEEERAYIKEHCSDFLAHFNYQDNKIASV